jgi:hypothetical protein
MASRKPAAVTCVSPWRGTDSNLIRGEPLARFVWSAKRRVQTSGLEQGKWKPFAAIPGLWRGTR